MTEQISHRMQEIVEAYGTVRINFPHYGYKVLHAVQHSGVCVYIVSGQPRKGARYTTFGEYADFAEALSEALIDPQEATE